ncbi:MAG: hypothetical protein EOM62_22050 [Bacteroidia bacterium]|nr:hypothetical protein [Bacteroidia bacterium]
MSRKPRNFIRPFSVLCSLFLAAVLLAAPACAVQRFDPENVYGPRIKKLCMVIITNSDSQVLAAEKGELDILSDITRPSDIDRLSRDPGLSMSLARGFHAFFLLLNNKSRPWDDPEVRHAAAEAIDRNNMVRTIYSGYCEPINSWLQRRAPHRGVARSHCQWVRQRFLFRLGKQGSFPENIW